MSRSIFSLKAQPMTEPQQSLEDVEAEMAELVKQTQAPVQRIARERHITTALPRSLSYVQPHPGVNDSGRLSAQAIALEHEKAAQEMESTARELIALARRCDQDTLVVVENNEQVHAKIGAVVNECHRAAAVLREQAKAIHDEIENASLLVDEVRHTVQDAVHRIRTRTQAPEPESEPAHLPDEQDDGT